MQKNYKILSALFVCFCCGFLPMYAQNKSVLFSATNAASNAAGIQVADHVSLNFTMALTIEAWIKPTAFTANAFQGTIVAKDNWATVNVNKGYVLRCGGSGVLDFTYGDGTNTWRSFTSATGVLTAGVWQHVAVTFSQNGVVKMYVNGVALTLASSGTVTGAIATSTQVLGIGTDYYDANKRTFSGQMDEVRLWNVVRTDAQLNIYKDRSLCDQTGLVAYYQLNESTGTTCTNSVAASAGNGTILTNGSGTATRQTTGIDLTTTENIVYVKTGVTNGNGTSWTNAYADLQDALALARNCTTVTQIWVAAGTYYPTSGTDRTISFSLVNNVPLYGGFPNTGNPTLADRDFVHNVTVLDGNIGNISIQFDNSIHVISNVANTSELVLELDGFTIANGYAVGSNDGGGGMYCYGNGALVSIIVKNCVFYNNQAYYGGGCYFGRAYENFINCVFEQNVASYKGGGVYSFSGSSVLKNCIFYKNSASGPGNQGGGYFGNNTYSISYTDLYSCTFLANFANNPSTGSDVDVNNSSGHLIRGFNTIFFSGSNIPRTVEVYNSLVPNYPLPVGVGNIVADAQFVDIANPRGADGLWFTDDDGLRLKNTSPCINTGINSVSGSNYIFPTTDILNNPRTGLYDMGAYEVVSAGVPNVYVDSSRVVSGAGHTWAAAFKTLSEATDAAWAFPNIQKVFVAKGSYTPQSLPYNLGTNQKGTAIVSTNNRDKTFHLRQGLELYGGYPTSGGTQNVALNPSVLNGKGVGGIPTDSAYHVVVIDSSANWNIANDTTKLVGFTIKNGKANGNFAFFLQGINQFGRYDGAGVAMVRGLNFLKDNTIQENTAASLGGGVSIYYGKNTLINNLIKNNKAVGGGGVFALRVNGNFKNNIFYQNTIANNFGNYNQIELASGGGMLCNSSKSLIANNLFAENTASKVGGGLSLVFCFDTIHNNTFYNNKILINDVQVSAGGGLFTSGVAGEEFVANYVSLKNNILWKNTIANDTTLVFSDAFLAVANGTVENNIFQLDSLNSANVSNYSTFANAPLIQNNKYKKNPRFLNGNNLLGADNQFRTSDDGLQLTGCSPAINSGLSLTSLGNLDVTGSPRIVYNKTDIGAYEYAGTTGCAVISTSSGIWENANTWSISRIPFQKDNVTINNNHTINITTNTATVKTLEYRPNSSMNFGNGLVRIGALRIFGDN